MPDLLIPPVPPLLAGTDEGQFRKWFAFWHLPLEQKEELVDAYPDLVIRRASRMETIASGGPVERAYLNYSVLETVPEYDVFKFYERAFVANGHYPVQADLVREWLENDELSVNARKSQAFQALNALNVAMLVYKYRHQVKAQDYLLDMSYIVDLVNTASIEDLISFYVVPDAQKQDCSTHG
jgi:hypothetical protein